MKFNYFLSISPGLQKALEGTIQSKDVDYTQKYNKIIITEQ